MEKQHRYVVNCGTATHFCGMTTNFCSMAIHFCDITIQGDRGGELKKGIKQIGGHMTQGLPSLA